MNPEEMERLLDLRTNTQHAICLVSTLHQSPAASDLDMQDLSDTAHLLRAIDNRLKDVIDRHRTTNFHPRGA